MTNRMRVGLLIFLAIIMAWFIWPTIRWYMLVPENEKELANLTIEDMEERKFQSNQITEVRKLKKVREQAVSLGLDLQGGVRITVQADFKDYARKIGHKPSEDERADAMRRLMERLRGRIDDFGVADVGIRRQEEDKIIVELPGAKDPDRARSLVMKHGNLEFKLVNHDAMNATGIMTNRAYDKDEIANLYPDSRLHYVYSKDHIGKLRRQYPIILYTNVELDGELLVDARSSYDPMEGHTVEFELGVKRIGDKRMDGPAIFADLTGDHVGDQLAIVLDGNVLSAPRINGVIPGGRGSITGSFTLEDAEDLSTILKEGALPLSVHVIEQQIVGEAIGKDAVDAGTKALLLALVLVVVYMLIIYRVSGLIAAFAMLTNLVLIICVLSPLHFTITLPAIAGLILTVGMSVDANVIIFERIREELLVQSVPAEAIHAGFDRAFWTIVDSNITTLITAFVLWGWGSGPIQGFAVTLFVGVLMNLITALLVTRFIFEQMVSLNLVKERSWLLI